MVKPPCLKCQEAAAAVAKLQTQGAVLEPWLSQFQIHVPQEQR